jgi:hypothetical protein
MIGMPTETFYDRVQAMVDALKRRREVIEKEILKWERKKRDGGNGGAGKDGSFRDVAASRNGARAKTGPAKRVTAKKSRQEPVTR